MKELLKNFIGQPLGIYMFSGRDSYLGTLDEVKEGYVVLKGYFAKDKTYLAMNSIESFKTEVMLD